MGCILDDGTSDDTGAPEIKASSSTTSGRPKQARSIDEPDKKEEKPDGYYQNTERLCW
jgi:hypothetical protein